MIAQGIDTPRSTVVIPAKAGILRGLAGVPSRHEIPAFAGMTVRGASS